MGSQHPECGLICFGTWAHLPQGMYDLPGPGIELLSLALQGRFLTTGPPGKPIIELFKNSGDLAAKVCPTLATPWTVACQTPLSMGFPRQAYWSGLPFPSSGDLPDPGIKPVSPALQAVSYIASGFFSTEPPEISLFKKYFLFDIISEL